MCFAKARRRVSSVIPPGSGGSTVEMKGEPALIYRRRVVVLVVAVLALLVPGSAQAAFPGMNGPIFFEGVRGGYQRGIYRMEADGSNVHRISPLTGVLFTEPSASGDGRKLAVTGCPPAGGDCEIYVINADATGTPVQVTNNSADEFEPAMSHDGQRVAFIRFGSSASGDQQDVWVANANGSGGELNLTGGTISPIGDPNNANETAGVQENGPTFSPNSARIAFTSNNPRLLPPGVPFELDFDTEVWVMDADGTDKQQLTEDHEPLTPIPFPPNDFAPNFSPDGTKVAWSRLIGQGNFDIVWRNASGAGSPAPLVTRPNNQETPTFSPDGTRIAYLESPPAAVQQIMSSPVNFAGGTSAATNLTASGSGTANANPDWAVVPLVPPPLRRTYPVPVPAPSQTFPGCPAATANVIRGTGAANSLLGTVRGDRIFALAGDDVADGLAGDDCIDLGAGADRGQGGDGVDLILGGLGVDNLAGNLGNDRLIGGDGGDRLVGGFGDDTLGGQSGSDRINGERGRDRINGGSSNDVISAGSSGDRASGDAGNDRVSGNSGNDSLNGNAGRDRMDGGSGRDRISGGSGADRISARDRQRDRINCGGGRDRVTADRIDRVARNCERVRRR